MPGFGGPRIPVVDFRQHVKAATTGALPAHVSSALTLVGAVAGALPNQDGVALAVGDDLLVLNEGGIDGTTSPDNGIWTVTVLGDGGTKFILTRRADCQQGGLVGGMAVMALQGATQAGNIFYCTTTTVPIIVGTTATAFMTAISASTGAVGGDLAGTLPNPTVVHFGLTSSADGGGNTIANVISLITGFGNGTATPLDGFVYGANATGANIKGADLYLSGGQSTGSGAPSNVFLRASPTGNPGSGGNGYVIFAQGTSELLYLTRGFGLTPTATQVAGPYAVTTHDAVVRVNTTGGAFHATLPAATAFKNGQRVLFKDVGGACGANNLTIDRAGADQIESGGTLGATFVINTNFGKVWLESDGTSKWFQV